MTKQSRNIIILIAACVLVGGLILVMKNIGSTSVNTEVEPMGEVIGDGSAYLHSDESFTFKLPSDFTFSDLGIVDDEKDISQVLFSGSPKERNFQISISPIEDSVVITIDQIKNDLPDMVIENPEEIAIAGARGVAFETGEKGNPLRTREIWFTYGSNLYQISTVKEFDEEMAEILLSWKWNQ